MWVGGVLSGRGQTIVLPLARGGLTPHPAVQTLLLASRFCGNNQPILWE